MKNNFFSSKKPKIGVFALLFLFCGLFSQTAMGQTTYVWITTTGSWGTAANWSTTAATATSSATTSGSPTVTLSVANANAVIGSGVTGAGIPIGATITAVSGLTLTISSNATATAASVSLSYRLPSATVPGNVDTDIVAVTNGGQVTLASSPTISKITLGNNTGSVGGSRLTINSGNTLTVTSSTSVDPVVLTGGSIVNNGILNISSTFAGATFGIRCGNAPQIPGSLTTFGYSGTGTLSIDTSTCGSTSGGILFNGVSNAVGITRVRYSMTLTSANTSFTLANNTPALKFNTGVAATPTYPFPVIIAGTGFTMGTEASPVTGSLLSLGAGTNVTVSSGVTLTLNSAALNASNGIDIGNSNTVYTTSFTNNGTINILGSTTKNGIKVSTYTFSGTPTINTTIVNGGTINVDINATATFNADEGPAAFAITSGYGPVSNTNQFLTFTNSGTLNLKNSASGTSIGQAIWVTGAGQRTYATFNNTGTITLEGTASNSGSLSTINNNINGIINSNNSFSGFAAITNNSSGTFNFTSSSAQTNAIVSPTTNSGTINTGAASDLSVVSGVSAASTGVIDPGGSSRKGIANFSTASTLAINSTLRLQIAADGTAGVNFDRITNSAAGGGFDITNAKLDVTSIYTPSVHTTIDIITTNATGTLTGSSFSQIVTALPEGWEVIVTPGTLGTGKVQLKYTARTTWDGFAWSNSAPTSSVDATINGTYSTATNGAISANNLTVNASRTLTVNAGATVTIAEALVNNGSIVVENNANLIQTNATNTNSGSGSVTVNRNGSTLKRLDYTLWSSPVVSQNLKGFSSLTVDPRFYTYNEGSDKFSVVLNPSGTTFTPGRSFFIRMPDQYPADSGNQTLYYLGSTTLAYPGVFTGTLNNGNIPVTLTKGLNGYQAVGNPYPSVIDAERFLDDNVANIEPTLYFWRKTNGPGTAYASYTDGGGTSTTATSGIPNGKIQVGQGFIVQAKNAGTVSNFFTNAMRDAAPTSTQFFKVKQQSQKDRVWLNLTGANDIFSQTLVAYVADGSVGLDKYDGKYINDSDIALTSSIAGDEYTIQGRPAFDATDVVALNFKTSVVGTYTIAIDHVDGLFSKDQDIYLVDKKIGVTTNLNEGAYSFTAEAGVDNTRFELTYQKTLKVDAPLFNENSVLVSRSNGTVNVKSNAVAINNVKVFDVQGRLVAERKNVKSNTASFSNLKANQVFIVKVTSENNAVVTKKVLN